MAALPSVDAPGDPLAPPDADADADAGDDDRAAPGAEDTPVRTVVGVGASAGGLAALKTFFEHVPEGSGLSFVVVVHLSPGHPSRLAEILQPYVRMPVRQVSESTPLQADCVYVIPPGRNLSAVDTHLRLSPLEEERRDRAPIDHFFRTLARTHDGHSVAVVLTGTGSDGTLGVRAVKENAGLTVVQDPAEAEYDGMPQSAVASGCVDLVLPLAEIPGAIVRYAQTEPQVPLEAGAEASARPSALDEAFALVQAQTGRDFSRYKRTTVLRRIARRMQMAQTEEIEDYLGRLRDDETEVAALADDLLVNVTHFFRDPEVFEVLATDTVPGLFEGRGPDDLVRVWSVGCATGEEAYSLAILLLEAAETLGARAPRIQVFASDLHEASLARAREGLYPADIEADVSPERLAHFFRREDGGYRVRAQIREGVVFTPHNLLTDPPFSRLDLIACRNLLIYLQRDVQGEVIELFHYALRPGGTLVLGTSETVEGRDLFQLSDEDHCVYRRRDVPAPDLRLPVFPLTGVRPSAHAGAARSRSPRPGGEPYGDLHQVAVERLAPPSLLVSPDDRVVHSSANAWRYLQHPGGAATTSAFRLVRSELMVELRTALRRARETGEPARSRPVQLLIAGEPRQVGVDARPLVGPEGDGSCLVIFDEREADAPPPAPRPAEPAEQDQVKVLEAELGRARERLQAAVEEDDVSREQLKASNEELQSANEELRSTMEELETSKEELQSMNEELQTVNQENRHKVEELAQLSGDLTNLMASTAIGTLFLDRALRIMRFTPQTGDLVNVRAADRGRPLSDLTHRLDYDGLLDDARQVLDRLVPIEREVSDDRGRWFLTRVLPYRTDEDRIEGVVVTFVEITARVQAEVARKASEERFRQVAETVPDVLFTARADGRIDYVSAAFEALTGRPARDALGTALWPLLIHPDDRARVEAAWAEARDQGRPFESRHRLRTPDGPCSVLTRARPVHDAEGRVERWFGTLTDVEAVVRAEAEVRELNATLEARVAARTSEVHRLARALTLAEQEERRRIAHLLHEDLQQILYGAQIKASIGEAKQLDALLQRAATLTRSLAHELAPPLLRGQGLAELFEWVAAQKQELHGLTVDVEVRGTVEVPEEHLRVLLYQLLRELLFNVAKHAETGRARIVADAVTRDDGQPVVRIVVEDEGVGFDPELLLSGARGPGPARGLGLASVRERLELVGGQLSIWSVAGGGTRVTVEVPIGDDEAPSDRAPAGGGR